MNIEIGENPLEKIPPLTPSEERRNDYLMAVAALSGFVGWAEEHGTQFGGFTGADAMKALSVVLNVPIEQVRQIAGTAFRPEVAIN